jgi:hypothetical protein
MRSVKAFMLGAGVAYLFDPTEGKRRRRVLLDRTASVGRKLARFGAKRTRFTLGRLRGLVARARRIGSRPATPDDATVQRRIRSEAFREAGVATKDVEVRVESGVATLEGSVVGSSLAEDLVQEVRRVPGVREVESKIRVHAPEF